MEIHWRRGVKAFDIVPTVVKMMQVTKSLTTLVETYFVVESGGWSQKMNKNDSPKNVMGNGKWEDVIFEVLIVVILQIWDVLLCCWVNSC